MKKIFFIFLTLVISSDFANARFGGAHVVRSRSFSRPSISRSYSHSATRSSTKAATKVTTKKSSQSEKKVDKQPSNENNRVQSSSSGLLPWMFYGYIINRSQSNGKISCDCSPLKDKSELYQECLRQCPKTKK